MNSHSVYGALPSEWPGGTSPPGSLRTVREPLDSYGSQRSVASQPSDLARAQGSSSEELAMSGLKLNHRRTFGPVPLQNLHPYYERLCPCAPHRYSGSCGYSHLSFSLSIGTTGSHVPCQSLIQVHAAFTPDTGRALDRLVSTFIPEYLTNPGFDVA